MYEKEKQTLGTNTILSVIIWFYRNLGRLSEFEEIIKQYT